MAYSAQYFSKTLATLGTVLALTALSACAGSGSSTGKKEEAMAKPTVLQSAAPFKVGEIKPTSELVSQFENVFKLSTPTDASIRTLTKQKDGSTKVAVALMALDKTQVAEFTLPPAESAQVALKEGQKLRVEKTGYGYALWAEKTMIAAMVKK